VADLVAAAEGLGGVDILVNNAAIFPRVPFLDMTPAQWDEVHAVNLRGSFLCAQAAARAMVARGARGALVNLSSGAAFRGPPRGAHYVAAKAGLVGLTRAIAQELAPYGIRANAVAPGLVDTAQPRYGMTEAEIAAAGDAVPLGRIAEPDDVADVVVFLCGEASRHVTGQVLHVNGGQYLG
jgi:3-oxoacyl-[acyl-carrier protein] reductase